MAKTKSWTLWSSSAMKAKWKLHFSEGFLIINFFIYMLLLWISRPSRRFKDLKMNFGLYWMQRPNSYSLFCAPIHKGFALSIWLSYSNQFPRTPAYYGFTNKPKSTCKYLLDKQSSHKVVLFFSPEVEILQILIGLSLIIGQIMIKLHRVLIFIFYTKVTPSIS